MSSDLATVSSGIVNKLLRGELQLPKEITDIIDVQSWARSLITKEVYAEPDPEYVQRRLLLQTLMADTIEEVFAQGKMRKLQESVANVPGASTGNIRIYDLYVTASDFNEGAKQYMLLSTTNLTSGDERMYSTGSTGLQAQVIASICLGVWPIDCQIIRLDRKDKGDRYLFWLSPPEGI